MPMHQLRHHLLHAIITCHHAKAQMHSLYLIIRLQDARMLCLCANIVQFVQVLLGKGECGSGDVGAQMGDG